MAAERIAGPRKANHRSLEAEVRDILEDIAARQASREESWAMAAQIRNSLGSAHHGDSTELIREDRDR